MSRPKKCRDVRCNPDVVYFKPRGVPMIHLEEIALTIDELEAIRLADFEELYHEYAAKKMKISRQTFVIVETDTSKITTVNNKDQEHAQGACNPLKKLNNEHVDAIVVGGIGMGALNVLNQSGIKVFQAQAPTGRGSLDLLKKGSLPEFTSQNTCAGQ